MKMPRLDLRELRFFVTLAEELHFRKAAERLNVAQPHLSAQLRELELKIGARLFDRTTRSVTLTPSGTRLVDQARYALQQIDRTAALAGELGQTPRPQLRIGFNTAACTMVLPWVLREFRNRCPDVDLRISYMFTVEQVRKLVNGEIDFGFLRTPVHAPQLVTPILTMEGAVVALPRNHKLADADTVKLIDLSGEDFVQLFPDVLGYDFEQQFINCCHRAGFIPRPSVKSPDSYSSLVLVSAGFGVALLPEWIASSSRPDIVFKRLPEIPSFIPLNAAWRTNRPAPEHEAFRKVITDFAQSHPLAPVTALGFDKPRSSKASK